MLQAGGHIVAPDDGGAMCAAYKDAVKSWCEAEGTDRGQFNDHVFSKLYNKDRAGYNQMMPTREVPVGFIGQAPGDRARVYAYGLSQDSSRRLTSGYGSVCASRASGNVANFLGDNPVSASTNFVSVRNQMSGMTSREMSGRFDVKHTLCPDAQRANGRPIEIKRPSEGESGNGQLKNYAKCSPDGKCELVNCASCDLPCKDWTNDCGPNVGAM